MRRQMTKFVAIQNEWPLQERDVMGNQQPTIRPEAGCCSCCGVHAYDAAMLRHLVSQFGASQVMIGTGTPFDFRDHSPVAHGVAVR